VAALCLAAALPLSAQQASLRLGGLRTEYSESLSAGAGSLGARLSWQSSRSSSVLDASWAEFDTGDGAGQAWFSSISIAAGRQPFGLGLRTDGVVNFSDGSSWTGLGTVEAFGALTAPGGLTLSAGINGGGFRSTTDALLAGAALRVRLDRRLVSLSASLAGTVSGTVRYADASVGAEWGTGRLSAGAFLAARTGDLAGRAWSQGYAAVQITPAVAFEASGGSYPRDLLGYQRGRFVNAGLRIRLEKQPATEPADPRRAATPALVIEPLDSTRTRLTVTAPGAASLAITGSWNEWTPVPLAWQGADRWTATLPIGAGTWRFALILSDGRWIVPAGVPKLPDDFGGEVGILSIQR
jgi:hypothetical protein